MRALTGKIVLSLVMFLGCAVANADNIARINLGGAWQVHKDGDSESIPASVPGCIHTDLMAAKKIPDPFYRDNEKRLQWISECNWIYQRTFEVSPDVLGKSHVFLRCEGLDTLAAIKVNGRTDNMFRTYEFDIKKLLKPGVNTIEIRFDSVLPVMKAKEAQRKLPTWVYPGSAYIRKEPCDFGWDWGPTLITCGIWRNIGIVAYDASRLEDVGIVQDHTKRSVELNVDVTAAPAADMTAKATVSFDGKEVNAATCTLTDGRGKLKLTVADPQLWWPNGMGKQPLYTVNVALLDKDGKLLDATTKRIGLRTLVTKPQTDKSPLQLVVNGVPFFSKGANWIPADCFPNRLTKETLRRYAADAVAANMNTLRFWGGGYYEDDDLFDACDELGICVWLDFKFGCSTYPAFDQAFLDNVRHEVRDNIKRLRHHPSIALWCGNNELMYLRDKQWTNEKMGEDDYYRLFRDVIGKEVHDLVPGADYVTGSPDCGDVHFWEVWHGGKPFEVFRDIHGFVSEFGFQSWPNPKTIEAFTEPEDRKSIDTPIMKYHERSGRMYMQQPEDGTTGTNKILGPMGQYFQKPKDFESAIWLSQILQGYGIKFGAEGWRREMPRSMGCVFWQYNDCWPGTSWASVDFFGRWKALQFMAQKFYAPILVSGLENAKNQSVDIYVTSDRMEDCQGRLTWTITDAAGKQLSDGSEDVAIPAHKSQKVRTLEKLPKDALVWLKVSVDGQTVSDNLVTFVYPKALPLVEPKLTAEIIRLEAGSKSGKFVVELKSEHPALWAWLDLDGIDARYSQNFVHVTKDSPAQVEVRPATPMSLGDFQNSLRVRSLYDTYKH
jgi:beta-mannosidase